MTNLQDEALESQISDALAYRASEMPASNDVPLVSSETRSNPRRHRALAAAAVLGLVVAASGVAVAVRAASDGHAKPQVQTAPSPQTEQTTAPDPMVALGTEVPLAVADSTDAIAYLVRQANEMGPISGEPFAVRAAEDAAIVVNTRKDAVTGIAQDCFTIAVSPTTAGYQGGCVDSKDAGRRLIYANDAGPYADTKGGSWYLAWTQLPAETAYVTFDNGGKAEWQRPVNGVSYFVWTGPRLSKDSPKLPEAIAFDANGRELSRASVLP